MLTLLTLPLALYALATFASPTFCATRASPPEPVGVELFVGMQKAPAHTYRIPTLCLTKKGTLLAFAEFRKNSVRDDGDIDAVMKRSTDGGKTWSEAQVILDFGDNTIGNITPIVDPTTGRITVLAIWCSRSENKIAPGFGEDSRLIYRIYSDDDGLTWSKPQNITASVKQPTWSWIATGPGTGIVLTRGKHKGRYVVPFNHRETLENAAGDYAHVVYSDDRGETWKSSQAFAGRHTSESQVVELENGEVLLNSRNYGSTKRSLAVTLSDDGGETWGETTWDDKLPEPQCQASLIRQSWKNGEQAGVLLFCNPASRKTRENLTLRLSTDEGKTWARELVIQPGNAAYSALAVMEDGTVCIVYETDSYKKILFTTRKIGDLEAAVQAPAMTAPKP